ncbi:MAG: PAS domain S-box protein [Elusimicrobia bacterium]|nr:PAS domain S-box protein [Elusimicrobiota bacterium]
MDEPSADAAPASSNQLAARYQRLVLVNRMSMALFGDKPFAAALPEACHTAMALMGAQSVAVYFVDELGRSLLAHRHADKRLSDDAAREEEQSLLTRAFTSKSIMSSVKGARGWEAAPLLRLTVDKALVTGGIVFGHVKATPLDPESEGSLVEIARHLRNARLIQQTLQNQKIAAAIVDQSSDAIFVTDLEQKVVTWNQGASRLFQWRANEALGRHGEFLVPKDRQAEVEQLIADVHKEGNKTAVETVRLRKDGSSVAIEGSFTLLKDDQNTPFAIVRAYRDITKRKEVERMKSDFVSLVSHELRTPLTAIRGFAETIFDFWDELPRDKRRHYMQIILDESKRLAQMVTDFLDISRIESGGIEPVLSEVSIQAVFERVQRLFNEHPAKPLFTIRIQPGAETLRADEEQIYRLFVNLVGNALKYTPLKGEIVLFCEASLDEIELGVSDQGPGISEKDRGRLFEKFFRASDAITRKTPGTGLGLAICKGIVEAHGGNIRVDSKPGQGARFVVRLPRKGPRS